MSDLTNILVGLSGLFGGAAVAFLAYYIQARIGKKKHLFDERYKSINNKAKAMSWNATLVILILAWAIIIIFEGPSLSFFVIMAVYVLHCVIYGIMSAIYSNQE
ncbi:DUF3796 domain-containing protein [Oceanobacillus bengalensis]|uniref:DUF3796 domain-containing protein n=1 Tax=Oceanobacillus bengalensis TaxID=1435466 RepID=UPI00160447D5|nr:DUF3796 domain-containing protein [Oceanobacillus bengalensis]